MCVCVSAVQDTPLRSSLIATGCGMRRAERRSSAAWFDSQMTAAAPGRTCMEICRKHANEDALHTLGVRSLRGWPDMRRVSGSMGCYAAETLQKHEK